EGWLGGGAAGFLPGFEGGVDDASPEDDDDGAEHDVVDARHDRGEDETAGQFAAFIGVGFLGDDVEDLSDVVDDDHGTPEKTTVRRGRTIDRLLRDIVLRGRGPVQLLGQGVPPAGVRVLDEEDVVGGPTNNDAL